MSLQNCVHTFPKKEKMKIADKRMGEMHDSKTYLTKNIRKNINK